MDDYASQKKNRNGITLHYSVCKHSLIASHTLGPYRIPFVVFCNIPDYHILLSMGAKVRNSKSLRLQRRSPVCPKLRSATLVLF